MKKKYTWGRGGGVVHNTVHIYSAPFTILFNFTTHSFKILPKLCHTEALDFNLLEVVGKAVDLRGEDLDDRQPQRDPVVAVPGAVEVRD